MHFTSNVYDDAVHSRADAWHFRYNALYLSTCALRDINARVNKHLSPFLAIFNHKKYLNSFSYLHNLSY